MYRKHTRGITVILVLVFAGVFGLSVAALMSFIFTQAQLGAGKEVREEALGIAEAGLDYYHWFLAHNPGDIENGTGEAGPYVTTYSDPEIGVIGSHSLDVVGNTSCGQLQSIDITSTGTSNTDTRFKRTVRGRHAFPSVAQYSYIIGDNVWAGADRNITGPYHSNGGVRMDGTNNSPVTSAVSSWVQSFNCNGGSSSTGVCGDGPNSSLWQYPVPEIDFDDIAANYSNLKSYAQSDGIYLAPYGSTEIPVPGGYPDTAVDGYHLIFNSDATVDIYQVTGTTAYWGNRSGIGWTADYHVIATESFIERRAIPSDCSLIFVEDKVWIEGTINGKVTVVAADVTNNYNPDVILRDDINYSTLDGSDGLTVLSEYAILIPPNSPDDLSLRGIFVAQGDRFGRAYYANDTKTQLTMSGTIVSNKRVGTSWTCSGSFCSGYLNRDNAYDRLQTTNPPPFTPGVTTTPLYVKWEEI